jgi:segregation and condensation protein A
MAYTVRLPVFEGPFDLLLHLIKSNEMDITDVRISEITQQYLDYVRMIRELDLELAGEFLVMAATLIHIKARSLLPVPPEPEENEEEIDEIMTARDLVRQLIEYRKYKEAAHALRHREEHASKLHFRTNIIQIVPEHTEELSEDVSLLYKAFARVLKFVEAPAYSPDLQEKFTVEDKITYLQEMLRGEREYSLEQVFKHCFNRAEVIVTFLAALELCRMKKIVIRQPNAFDEIMVVAAEEQLEHGAQPND